MSIRMIWDRVNFEVTKQSFFMVRSRIIGFVNREITRLVIHHRLKRERSSLYGNVEKIDGENKLTRGLFPVGLIVGIE
jgi:hypothetical protein